MDFRDREFQAALERVSRLTRRRRATLGRSAGQNAGFRRGHSPEFSDYRPYQAGDDPRFLDWNLFRRLGKPYTKLFQEEEDAHIQLLLDTSASMAEKFRRVLQLVALTGAAVLESGNRLEVVTHQAGGDSATVPAAPLLSPVWRGGAACPRFFDFLGGLCPDGRQSPAELCDLARRRRILGSGVRILFSDFFAETDWVAHFRALSGRWQDFCAVQILSEQELNPMVTGRCLLQDRESGRQLSCEPGVLHVTYRKELAAQHALLHGAVQKAGGLFARIPVTAALSDAVRITLHASGLIR